MDIRHILTGLLLGTALLLPSAPARAQEVVIDPTQIGVAIENSSQSISEMISMLEQLHINNETLKDIWGAGEKIIEVADRFKDAGQLVELTERYNALIRQAADYAGKIGEWSDEEYFDGYERMMRYITECVKHGEKVVEAYSNFFKFLKTNDADKNEALQKAIEMIQKEIDEMTFEYEDIKVELRLGSDIVAVTRLIENGSTSEGYARVYAGLGDGKAAAGGWIGIVRIIVAVILVVSVIAVFVQTNKGQGGPASLPFIRFFGITVVVYALLELLNSFIY
jgi:hypothetical protein